MQTLYFVRHQAHGIVHEFPFLSPPSEEQQAPVLRYCFQLHGFGHAKTPTEPYWTRVVPVEAFAYGEVPSVPERALGLAGKPGVAEVDAPQFVVSGTGHISKL